ncbi:dihydrolipoyl dehydrogenase [Acidobacteria bacterium AH-259-L09]|nr:dihydrolipoyl dehydrogenase [Acidobacteria bacterium AH-259-L09]
MAESSRETELVVIGAGPGGYAAAFHAADLGLDTILVDTRERPGGICLYAGCIPSKALLFVAELVGKAHHAEEFGIRFGDPKIDLEALRKWKERVVGKFTEGLSQLVHLRGIEFVRGRARFESSESLRLRDSEVSEIKFKNAIVATGSRPVGIPGVEIESDRAMDSTTALELEEVPETLLVVGGGYIGLELGTVYASLGSRLTLVELTDGLLPGVDRDLVRPLHKRMQDMFASIHLNTKVVGMEETKKGVQVDFEGEIEEDRQTFEKVLVCVGRRSNSDDLGLEKTRVEIDEKGFIKIDNQCRTTDSRIFAVGDVASEPMLAHKATREGKVTAEVIAGQPAVFDNLAIPAVVFTDPEVAWCGVTETQAKSEGREVKVTRFPWAASGRALTLGRLEGLTKMIFDPETGRILGVGIVGPHAGELIAEGVLAIEMGAVAEDLAAIIHTHPTLSETMGEVAEAFLGRALHIYRR